MHGVCSIVQPTMPRFFRPLVCHYSMRNNYLEFQAEGERSLPLHPESGTRILPTTNVMSDNDSNGSEQYSSSDDDF